MTAEERNLELRTRAKDILIGFFKKHSVELQEEFEENREEFKEAFAGKLMEVIHKWKKAHEDGVQELKYIVVSYLESSTITGTYEFQIAAYDKNIYGETNPVCIYWTPAFVYRYLEEDMKLFREMIAQEMIQVKADEVEEVRRRYVLNYHFIAICIISGLAVQMAEMEGWKEIGIGEIDILYGAYMEQAAKIGCISGRK